MENAESQAEIDGYDHPTSRVPTSVALVSLGETTIDWVRHRTGKNREQDPWDEVWTLNRGIMVYDHDLAFVMDDLEGEVRGDPRYANALKNNKKPIITSRASSLAPMSKEYPLAGIVRMSGRSDPYLHNSIPMIVAYCCYLGVQSLTIFGADYTLADGRVLEPGRANVEYWIGIARQRGMEVAVTSGTTLLDARSGWWVYGYADQVRAREVAEKAAAEGGA